MDRAISMLVRKASARQMKARMNLAFADENDCFQVSKQWGRTTRMGARSGLPLGCNRTPVMARNR